MAAAKRGSKNRKKRYADSDKKVAAFIAAYQQLTMRKTGE